MSSATYLVLLRLPGAAGFFLSATVGRIGIAMTTLSMVWLVHGQTGSYATAGWVTGGFAVAEAVAGPQLARLIDRLGQSRVLPPLLGAHAISVVVLLALVTSHASLWLMITGGVLTGVTIPQLGALSTARWPAFLNALPPSASQKDGQALLTSAFTLESLANAVSFLVGPAVASVIAVSGNPVFGTVLAAALVVAGGLCLATQHRTAPPPAARTAANSAAATSSLLRPGFAVLAGVNFSIGVFFAAMRLSVTAFALEHGGPDTAAALFTVSNSASVLAGWLYGLRRWQSAPRIQLTAAAGGLAFGALPMFVAGSPAQLAVTIAVAGLAIPVILVLSTVLTESAVHRSALTQAFTWLNSASVAGSACAAALSGQAIDTFGAPGGFVIAIAATIAITALATLGIRTLRPTS